MRYQGKITKWENERGFGFITPNDGSKKVFVHAKSFTNRSRLPLISDLVTYVIKFDANDRAYAESVSYVGEKAYTNALSQHRSIHLILSVAFLFIVAGLVITGKLPLIILGLYLALSFVTLCAYALDKSAARNDGWRTQESTLHLFAVVGGWPGALAAQNLLRHKTKKQSFQVVFWITVLINSGILFWLVTPSGNQVLYSFLNHFNLL